MIIPIALAYIATVAFNLYFMLWDWKRKFKQVTLGEMVVTCAFALAGPIMLPLTLWYALRAAGVKSGIDWSRRVL